MFSCSDGLFSCIGKVFSSSGKLSFRIDNLFSCFGKMFLHMQAIFYVQQLVSLLLLSKCVNNCLVSCYCLLMMQLKSAMG
jgi:hypothetical protein